MWPSNDNCSYNCAQLLVRKHMLPTVSHIFDTGYNCECSDACCVLLLQAIGICKFEETNICFFEDIYLCCLFQLVSSLLFGEVSVLRVGSWSLNVASVCV